METEQGMLTALTAGVGGACKCLTLFTPGHPLKPHEEEPENLTYAVRAQVFCFVLFWGGSYKLTVHCSRLPSVLVVIGVELY